jgi:hypothetical protein
MTKAATFGHEFNKIAVELEKLDFDLGEAIACQDASEGRRLARRHDRLQVRFKMAFEAATDFEIASAYHLRREALCQMIFSLSSAVDEGIRWNTRIQTALHRSR